MSPAHYHNRVALARHMADLLLEAMSDQERRDPRYLGRLLDMPDHWWRGARAATGRTPEGAPPSPETRLLTVLLLARSLADYLEPMECPTCGGEGGAEVPVDGRHPNVSREWAWVDCPDCLAHPGHTRCEHCGRKPAVLTHEDDEVCLKCWTEVVEAPSREAATLAG